MSVPRESVEAFKTIPTAEAISLLHQSVSQLHYPFIRVIGDSNHPFKKLKKSLDVFSRARLKELFRSQNVILQFTKQDSNKGKTVNEKTN